MVSKIDINLRLISIAIDCYRLSVYRLTTPGEQAKLNFVHNPQNQQFRENETINDILKEMNNLSGELLTINTVG